MKRNLILLFSVFLLPITLSACDGSLFGGEPTSIPVELQDRSWLTGTPCALPCWNGLIPEVSTESEVFEFIEEFKFYDQTTMRILSSAITDISTGEQFPAKRILVKYKGQKEEKGDVSFEISLGYLKTITLLLNYDITMIEIVDQIGPPDFLLAEGYPQMGGELYCYVGLVWVDKQLYIGFGLGEDETMLDKCEAINNGMPLDPKLDKPFVMITYPYAIRNYEEYFSSIPWPGFEEAD